jgi:hypothetical protein
MAFIETITELDSYKTYLGDIGEVPSYRLEKCFACGLPGVWLYMKSIGLEDEFFQILDRAKDKSALFKDLFYLLMHTNTNNQFFPKVPEDLLKIEIPKQVLDAQLDMPASDFQMVYSFTREELKETLLYLALPNKMIRIGNKQKSVGIMYSDKIYSVYHADNPRALEFKTIDGCIDAVLRAFGEGEEQ